MTASQPHLRSFGRVLAALSLGVLAACSSDKTDAPFAGFDPQYAPATKKTNAPAMEAVSPDMPADKQQPLISLNGAGTTNALARMASAQVTPEGDISLTFVEAPVEDVLKAVMGDVLGLTYHVTAKTQGVRITLQTSRPIHKENVLPTLERVLQAHDLALVNRNGSYDVMPLEQAAQSGAVSMSSLEDRIQPGQGTHVIPLKYTSAKQLSGIIESFVPKGATMQIDESRNLLLISGNSSQVQSFLRLVNVFDVDYLAGQSFGLFPLEHASPSAVAKDLTAILDTNAGPLVRMVRIIPLDRINAVLVASTQPSYIGEVQTWIDRLDSGWNDSASQLYVYHVQNSKAVDLAKVLSSMFGENTVKSIAPEVMPGAATAEIGDGTITPNAPQTMPALPQGKVTSGDATVAPAPKAAPALPPIAASANANAAANAQQPRIVADEKNNTLVIMAKPGDYRMIEAAVRKLDVLPLQVLIEATIAEVTLTDQLKFGLQWFFRAGGPNQFTLSGLATGAVSPVFPGFDYVLNKASPKVVLNALSSVTNVNVLSAPQLMVLDHQTATLQVGDEVPIVVQQARGVTDPAAPIVNSIELRDTGVILKVTPGVNSSGVTTLQIEQEVSDVTRTTTSDIDSPTIQQRKIKSVVSVADGETIALGGLIRENNTAGKDGIPYLSDIPGLGLLFGQRSKSKARTELLILLTPKVVRNSEEAKSVTDELRQRLSAIRFKAPGG